jgi:hypothetical protein
MLICTDETIPSLYTLARLPCIDLQSGTQLLLRPIGRCHG